MITASIVTYNHSLADIEPALKSLLGSIVRCIYIIDHSKDKSLLRKEIEGYDERIIYIEHENKGYGSGHNVALRKAIDDAMDYHIVVNPDVWFDSDIISNIEAYMDAHEEVGHLMPGICYPNGETQRLCKLLPTPLDLFGRLCIPFLTNKRNYRFELVDSGYDKRMNVPYLSGCFMFFRVSALKTVGLFDEHFFMYAEDVDMTRRIHREYVTLFYPDVNIYHKFSRASRRELKLFFVHVINLAMYFNKYGWFFDKERTRVNRETLQQISSLINKKTV